MGEQSRKVETEATLVHKEGIGSMTFTIEQIRRAAETCLESVQVDELLSALTGQVSQNSALTIICNRGIHAIPEEQLPGRVVAATEGNVSDQNADQLTKEVVEACRKVAAILKHDGPFSEVYLVPSGYGVLLQKLAEIVFQILAKPAVTLHFDRKTRAYWPIELDVREIISGS